MKTNQKRQTTTSRSAINTNENTIFKKKKEIPIVNYHLKNNKRAGRDDIKVKLLKFQTEEVAKEIAVIYLPGITQRKQ